MLLSLAVLWQGAAGAPEGVPAWVLVVLPALGGVAALLTMAAKWQRDGQQLALEREKLREQARQNDRLAATEQRKADAAERDMDVKSHAQAIDALNKLCTSLGEQIDRQRTQHEEELAALNTRYDDQLAGLGTRVAGAEARAIAAETQARTFSQSHEECRAQLAEMRRRLGWEP